MANEQTRSSRRQKQPTPKKSVKKNSGKGSESPLEHIKRIIYQDPFRNTLIFLYPLFSRCRTFLVLRKRCARIDG